MSRSTAVTWILLILALVSVSQQRPRGYGDLRLCPPGQKCGLFRVEMEEIDGKKYYVLRHYPGDEGVTANNRPTKPNKGDEDGVHQPFEPTYIIGVPTGTCPEGQLLDHSGKCRDAEY